MSRTLLIIIGAVVLIIGVLAYIAPDLVPSIKTALGSWNGVVKIVIGLVVLIVAFADKK